MSTPDSSAKLARCRALVDWLQDRTGLPGAWRACPVCTAAPVARWWSLWATLFLTALAIQAITGFFLWMYYSPSAQTAWESVYYLQYEVAGGWLIRGLHHWTAHVLVALLGLYVAAMIVRGAYRAPREFVFWTALLMGLIALALCLTGDLLSWDQEAYGATQTRVSFLMLLPGIGGWLYKLAAGGAAFGHLTLTRFFALHVGCFAGAMLLMFCAHVWCVRRAAASPAAGDGHARPAWGASSPSVHGLASLALLAVVLAFVFSGALGSHAGQAPGDYLGIDLGAPADRDPANVYKAARPEWSFRGLYGFANVFPGEWKILPIFVFSSLFVLLVLAMPLVARFRGGHAWNLGVLAVLGTGLVVFSAVSWIEDALDKEFLADVAAANQEAARVKELARGPDGIPVSGALSLLRNDPLTQGPRLFKQQCETCHNCTGHDGRAMATEKPSAPDLSGYGSREWVAGFLDAEKIKSPKYFGDTRFAAGVMVRYVESQFAKLDPQQKQAIVAALSAEARLEAQADLDRKDKALIEQGRQLIASRECTRCHRFCQSGKPGNAPDLTGYASREWTLGLLADPTHSSFYGPRNDRMPVYVEAPAQVEKDRLAPDQVGLVTDWLRGQWYVEPVSVGHVSVGHVSNVPGTMQPSPAEAAPKTPVLLALGVWEARRLPQEKPPADHSAAAARALFVEEHCGLCHAHTGTPGGDIVPDDPSAPDLGGFASRAWIAGLLDPKQVDGPKYFGNSVFKKGDMVEFVKGNLKQLRDEIGDDELDNLIDALAAETRKEPKPGQKPAPPDEDVALLFEDFTCTDCHKFYGKGESTGPELTGYGSRAWLVGILSDPTARQFYGKNNYGMPSYRMFPKEPDKNLLDEQRLGLLAGWLRGKLEQPQPATTAGPRS